MKNVKKRGFTIVELVIVIAVIAILSAVLIPTFSNLVKESNLTADEVAVRNMNTVLAVEKVMDDNIKEIYKVRTILEEAGYNGDDLEPLSKDYKFYWSSTYNVVLLVNCESENKNEWFVVYPTEGYERAIEEFNNPDNHGVSIFDLANVPYAEVELITSHDPLTADDLAFQGYSNGFYFLTEEKLSNFSFDTILKFSAVETEEEAANAEYGEWGVDFLITSNMELPDEDNIEIYLGGRYQSFLEGDWVILDIAEMNFTVPAQEPIPLLGSFMNGGGLPYKTICEIEVFETYLKNNNIVELNQDFNCSCSYCSICRLRTGKSH